ncbi:hypothetical protein N2152v2_006883 [Parachlorella kessleri]
MSPPLQPQPSSPGARYGLGLGEAESADEDSDDELTARELRVLQQSAAFHQYLRGRGLSAKDVEGTARKLRLYRQLRQVDPSGFVAMCRGSNTPRLFVTEDPSGQVLALEYVVSMAAGIAATVAVAYAWAAPAAPAALRASCLALAWWLTVEAWRRGRSSGGRLLGLWYEELTWGHAPPAWRVIAAGLLELGYVLGSAGLGTPVSLFMRCWRGRGGRRRGQSVGERLAGVRLVREVALDMDEAAARQQQEERWQGQG